MSKKIDNHFLILAVVVTIVFFGSLLLLPFKEMFISPDETASAFFIQRFAQTGTLFSFDAINATFDDQLTPRSTVSVDGRLAPGSFLGLIVLYGTVASLLGFGAVFFLTPLLAALASFAWYGICQKLFDKKVALLSAILLSIHPAWWYYSARGLMHNVLFVCLLIFCVYFVIARPVQALRERSSKKWTALEGADTVLAGLMLGLGLFVRTSEALWIAAAIILVGVMYLKQLRVKTILLFVLSVLLAFSPFFFLNRALYGSPLATGYSIDGEVVKEVSPLEATTAPPETSRLRAQVETALQPAFPFGIHPRAVWNHVKWYGVELFWWMALLSLIGIPLLYPTRTIAKPKQKKRSAYLVLSVMVGGWLAMMYGSWVIHDNPDPTLVTMANSYVRYWLPVYILMTPFAAYTILWLSRKAWTDWGRNVVPVIFVIGVFSLSIHTVFFKGPDSLRAVAATLSRSEEIRSQVLAQTQENSVIVVDRSDKIFFPYRRIRQPLRSEITYELLPRLERRVPVYYYGITLPEEDLQYLNTAVLGPRGLRIEFIQTFDDESLYQIESP